MSLDLSFLSSDTLLYFLTHSAVFVVSVASVFFFFGLAFGWLTWGRLKWQRRLLLSEAESLKDEVATLKRKLAEQATRTASLAESATPDDASAEEKHASPDPVIHSFLSAAAAVLPQTSASTSIGHPEISRTASTEHPTTESPASPPARSEVATGKAPLSPAPLLLSPETKPRLVSARDLAHKLSADRAPDAASFSVVPSSSSSPAPSSVQATSAADGTEPPAPGPDEATAIPNHEAPGYTAPFSGNGEARLISDPHLGLIYASRPSLSDDLNHLKGVAHIIEGRLNEFGVYTFKQIALWNDENISEFSHRLAFKDRIRRERWVEQARELHFQKYGERL